MQLSECCEQIHCIDGILEIDVRFRCEGACK